MSPPVMWIKEPAPFNKKIGLQKSGSQNTCGEAKHFALGEELEKGVLAMMRSVPLHFYLKMKRKKSYFYIAELMYLTEF